MRRRPKIGDVFEIPLSNGKLAYGQYLHYSKMGPIIRVFDLIVEARATVEQVLSSSLLFPPVITGLFAAIKDGTWKVVGQAPIVNFVHPKFVSTLYDQKTGKARTWFLWDGERDLRIGSVLGPDEKQLEFLVVWSPRDVARRIETGEDPFPYGDLILYNRFMPAG